MKNNSDQLNNVFAVLAISLLLLAIANISVTLIKENALKKQISGYVSSASGFVNVTVSTNLDMTVSRTSLNFGSGSVYSNQSNNATLFTTGETATVNNGSWDPTGITSMMIQNTGTLNFSLNVSADNNYSLIGGTSTTPMFQINVSSNDSACTKNGYSNLTGTPIMYNPGTWINLTQTGFIACNNTAFLPTQRTLLLDYKLVIPSNAVGGSRNFTVTLYAQTAT
jgi:hypothetical protein